MNQIAGKMESTTGHETTHPLTPASLISFIDLGSQDLDLVLDLLDLLVNGGHLELVLLAVRLRLSLLVDKCDNEREGKERKISSRNEAQFCT